MATLTTQRRRRGPKPAEQLARPDVPYTMKLPDGRTIYVEVPGRWMTAERGGELAFAPQAVRFLDRVRALAMGLDASKAPPSPGFLTTLREALGLTQAELGEQLGVDSMTVSRWERGTVRPGKQSLAALERIRREATRKGVTIPT